MVKVLLTKLLTLNLTLVLIITVALTLTQIDPYSNL